MKIYSKNKLAWVFGCFLAIIFITGFSNLAQSAQDETQQCRSDNGWCLEVALPGLPSGQPIKEPGQYIRLLYLLGVGIAGVLAVLIIIYAGFQWMTSPAVGTIENAKQMITNAISGIIILLSSYLILNTINPDLVSLKMPELEKLQLASGNLKIEQPTKNTFFGGTAPTSAPSSPATVGTTIVWGNPRSKSISESGPISVGGETSNGQSTTWTLSKEAYDRYGTVRNGIVQACREAGYECKVVVGPTIDPGNHKSPCHNSGVKGQGGSGTCADLYFNVNGTDIRFSPHKTKALNIIDKKLSELYNQGVIGGYIDEYRGEGLNYGYNNIHVNF